MKDGLWIAAMLVLLVASCGPGISPTATPDVIETSVPVLPSPTDHAGAGEEDPRAIRPPSPDEYCWNTTGLVQRPAQLPTPFLYQPFEGLLSESTWTAQMDHDYPNYTLTQKIATLGESIAGEARTGCWGDSCVLSYHSPSLEIDFYYDGHDGNDFGVTGSALAAADGEVVFAGSYGNLLGRVVEIYHPQGYLTRYAHLASFEEGIWEGTEVRAGEPIGQIGGSAVVDGVLTDNYWDIHLHFSVFRWNQEQGIWQITDPFGWDPWMAPDQQWEDPLVRCNGEISYNLWVDGMPRPYDKLTVNELFYPTQDRYIGGWLGEELNISIEPTPMEPTPAIMAEVRDNGKVYLGSEVILDMITEVLGCFGTGKIDYSPTYEHFIVVLDCFEGDNEAFVFNSDGSGKQRITSHGDYLSYYHYSWSPSGRWILYQSIYPCYKSGPPDGVLTTVSILYNTRTQEKKTSSTRIGSSLQWSPNENRIAFLSEPETSIYVFSTDASTLHMLGTFSYDQSATLSWEQESPEIMLLHYTTSNQAQNRTYAVSTRPEVPPPGTLVPPPIPDPGYYYRVVNVQSDDVLNIRSGPGVQYPISGFIPPSGTNIQITGVSMYVNESLWVPIMYKEVTGWVNKYYLAEQADSQ